MTENIQDASMIKPVIACDDSRDWKKLNGADAYLIIGRHAENWTDIGSMMENWARKWTSENPEASVAVAPISTNSGDLQNRRDAGFVLVPATTLPGGHVVPAFCVAQYAASKGDDGKVVIDATRKPWTNINFADSKVACSAAGYSMITETQWLAIAYNASQQAANWTGGAVGEGDLFQGYRNGSGPLAGDTTIGNTGVRRWLDLSNGSRVYDFNGNVFQWVFDDVRGGDYGLIAKKIKTSSLSMTVAPYPSETKGMGWRPDGGRDWSGRALFRGGCWSSDVNAGAFRLSSVWPGSEDDRFGFRCTKPSPGL